MSFCGSSRTDSASFSRFRDRSAEVPQGIAPYDNLVAASQDLLNQAVTGAETIKQALDELATTHQKILDAYKEKLKKK